MALFVGGTVDNSSELDVPGTRLHLRGLPLRTTITGTLSTDTGTEIEWMYGGMIDLSGGLLKLGGDLNLDETVTDNDTRLILQADATLGNSPLNLPGIQLATGIGSLDLNGSALTISMPLIVNDTLRFIKNDIVIFSISVVLFIFFILFLIFKSFKWSSKAIIEKLNEVRK